MDELRISFCTVSMNRLFTLKQSLPANLEAMQDQLNVEFLLLDYNSTDGLEDWIRNTCSKHISRGLLSYYKIVDPKPVFFSHSHSRNIAFRLAAGDILCNVNADYYVGHGLPEYVRSRIVGGKKVALISNIDKVDKDNLGRICMRKTDYLAVGGFDEQFNGYGYEDIDLSMRLKMAGVNLKYLPESFYKEFVIHEDIRRVENMYDNHWLYRAFKSRIDRDHMSIVFLYKNGLAEKGTLIRSAHDIPGILEGGWLKGTWQRCCGKLSLSWLDGSDIELPEDPSDGSPGLGEGRVFKEITGEANRIRLILYKSQIYNYQLLKNRRRSGVWQANKDGFGKAIVQKNFSEEIMLV
jgi:hypothetical protein